MLNYTDMCEFYYFLSKFLVYRQTSYLRQCQKLYFIS